MPGAMPSAKTWIYRLNIDTRDRSGSRRMMTQVGSVTKEKVIIAGRICLIESSGTVRGWISTATGTFSLKSMVRFYRCDPKCIQKRNCTSMQKSFSECGYCKFC
jgi:hypothetical protein